MKKKRLKSTDDLLRAHGIDYKAVQGYENLSEGNKAIYKKFIVNMFNSLDLKSRSSLVPTGIYWVEETQQWIESHEQKGFYDMISAAIYEVDKDGNKRLLHKFESEEHEGASKTANIQYLRFEYKDGNLSEWGCVSEDGEGFF